MKTGPAAAALSILRLFYATALALLVVCDALSSATAQTRTGAHANWAFFTDGDICWIATRARGDEQATMISAFKDDGGVEFSFNLDGRDGAEAAFVSFGGFELAAWSRGDWVWLIGPPEDAALHNAIMAGEGDLIELGANGGAFSFSAEGYRSLMEAAPTLCVQPMS